MPPSEHNNEDSDISVAAFTAASNYLRSRVPQELSKPKVAIICGSGLGGLSESIEDYNKIEFPYEQIPGFVKSTVVGHAGKLVFGLLGKNRTPTVFMVGRFHGYEGYNHKQITLPVRVFKLLGAEILIVTGASGSLSKDIEVGNVGVLIDHISIPSLAGLNPLTGPNLSAFGPRFPAMSDAYDYDLRVKAFKAAEILKFSKNILKEVVYCHSGGPFYETRAEARMLKLLGGDIVGMSTVPEIIVARHCGLRVLGLSLVTNMVVIGNPRSANPANPAAQNTRMTDEPKVNHEEVIAVGKERASDMQKLVKTIVELI